MTAVFGPVGSQLTEAVTVLYLFLTQKGSCYLDSQSKLVLHNENKFGLFRAWVGRFCFCGAGDKPGSRVHAGQGFYYRATFPARLKIFEKSRTFPMG